MGANPTWSKSGDGARTNSESWKNMYSRKREREERVTCLDFQSIGAATSERSKQIITILQSKQKGKKPLKHTCYRKRTFQWVI